MKKLRWSSSFTQVNLLTLEKFYSMEAGFYVLTGWGVLGFLISCAYYILLQTFIELIVYKLWDRDRIVH